MFYIVSGVFVLLFKVHVGSYVVVDVLVSLIVQVGGGVCIRFWCWKEVSDLPLVLCSVRCVSSVSVAHVVLVFLISFP